MAFIAVNAKADIIDSKKGKITPAQNAVINAWTLSKKTGILNLGEGYRCEAQVGNIVGNQQEIVFNRGYFVVYGRLVEIEQGTTILVDLGNYEGRIVAKFNLLASQEGEFQVVAQRKNVVLASQNLNINPTGECDFVLYNYQATTSSVSLDTRDNSIYIEDVGNTLEQLKDTIKKDLGTPNTGTGRAPLDGYVTSKGTVEERLQALGFKQGSVTGLSGATLTAMGKYAILKFPQFSVQDKNLSSFTMTFKSAYNFVVNLGAIGSDKYVVIFTFTEGSNQVSITSTATDVNDYMFVGPAQIGFEISAYQDNNSNWVDIS